MWCLTQTFHRHKKQPTHTLCVYMLLLFTHTHPSHSEKDVYKSVVKAEEYTVYFSVQFLNWEKSFSYLDLKCLIFKLW